MPPPPLIVQTTYAELVERCATAAFESTFSKDGVFVAKTLKGRRYWYFQLPSNEGRAQKYVGPETPQLLKQIAKHKEARDDERERRALVSGLIRSLGLSRPLPEIGDVIAALAKAGVFRLRGVLVGTVAYQTYSAMLGVRLPSTILQTGDIDIAQFGDISIAVEDKTPPVLEVLKEVDSTFRAVPTLHPNQVTSYAAKGGLRVEFLTPNVGPDTDAPQHLAALQTDAQPLRFLDFLIYDAEPAVFFHDSGIYVNVPSPQRYAIHKLIISTRRHEGTAKRDKDIQQAEALIDILSDKRPRDLKLAWMEAYEHGGKWRKYLLEGLSDLKPVNRDRLLKVAGQQRSLVPDIDLTFDDPVPVYDFSRDVIVFDGKSGGTVVPCAISREALDDHFGTDTLDQQGRIEAFRKNRETIQNMAQKKYMSWPIEDPGTILIKTTDVLTLLAKHKS
jgi:hypothetical protein